MSVGIVRLNHAVLYVRDADQSAAFYRDVLGFTDVFSMRGARFLRAPGSDNDHDLGLFSTGAAAQSSTAGQSSVGLYHLAWEVPTLGDLREHRDKLRRAGALGGASDHGTTKSLYARDADGLEFEVMWRVPPRLLSEALLAEAAAHPVRPLDLDAEITRYGADTRA